MDDEIDSPCPYFDNVYDEGGYHAIRSTIILYALKFKIVSSHIETFVLIE